MHSIYFNLSGEYMGYMKFYMDSYIPEYLKIKYPDGGKNEKETINQN